MKIAAVIALSVFLTGCAPVKLDPIMGGTDGTPTTAASASSRTTRSTAADRRQGAARSSNFVIAAKIHAALDFGLGIANLFASPTLGVQAYFFFVEQVV